MVYSFAKFGDFTFNRFDFIVRTNTQNHTHADADDRCTHAYIITTASLALSGHCCHVLRQCLAKRFTITDMTKGNRYWSIPLLQTYNSCLINRLPASGLHGFAFHAAGWGVWWHWHTVAYLAFCMATRGIYRQGRTDIDYGLTKVSVVKRALMSSTPWAIKTCHFVFDYNSGFSWSIFVLFVPVETVRNAV